MTRPLALYAAAIYTFLHLPLVVLAVFSVNSSRFTVWEGFSMRWYRAVFADTQLLEAAWNSLVIAAASTALATTAGTLCAYGLWKRRAPVLSGALYVSLVTPEIVSGVSLLAFFQWLFRWRPQASAPARSWYSSPAWARSSRRTCWAAARPS